MQTLEDHLQSALLGPVQRHSARGQAATPGRRSRVGQTRPAREPCCGGRRSRVGQIRPTREPGSDLPGSHPAAARGPAEGKEGGRRQGLTSGGAAGTLRRGACALVAALCGRESIFLFSHTNEFCGKSKVAPEARVACSRLKWGRRVCERGQPRKQVKRLERAHWSQHNCTLSCRDPPRGSFGGL